MLLCVYRFVSPLLWGCISFNLQVLYIEAAVGLKNEELFPCRKLRSLDYDLQAWRDETEKKASKDLQEGFKLLDMDDGAGWAFVKKLVCYDPKKRLSSSQALRHRLLAGNSFGVLDKISDSIDELATPLIEDLNVEGVTGPRQEGGLTESQLAEELGFQKRAPAPERNQSATIAWWKDREVIIL